MGQKVVDFSTFESRLHIVGTLRLETALRIGAGGMGGAAEVDLPVVKDLADRPYIPGSSFKGAFRAHTEALLRALDSTLACTSTSKPQKGTVPGCLTQEGVDHLKERYADDPYRLGQELIASSCWACKVFGAPWLASKVLIKDLFVADETWFGHYLERQGVAIDRDSETAGEHLLYEFEAVPAGTAFEFEMVVENATEAEQGLVLLGLREFENGRVPLGGGRSRGLGQVILDVDWEHSEKVDQDSLREYLVTGQGQPLDDPATRQAMLNAFLEEVGVKDA
jgi:CRISPR-associated RAMP protein (TIGR02581 family)